MTAFVLDASVTMAWCFADESTDYAESLLDRLQQSEALVPSIWPLEVTNVLLVAERRNRITEAQSVRFIEFLRSLPITVDDTLIKGGMGSLLMIGRICDVSSYDAAYLDLSTRHGLPLATLDDRLKAAAQRLGVPLAS